MKSLFGRSVRALLACVIALLAGGVLVRQQAFCAGCQPGNFTYDDPVGCDSSCHVIYSGKLTATCNGDCEASVLQGSCSGTKGSCVFHRNYVVKPCGGPPAPPPAPTGGPAPTNTTAPIATNTVAPEPSPAPTETAAASSTPAPTATPFPTSTALPSATSSPLPTNTALPTPSATPPPTDTPLPSPTPTDTPRPTGTSTTTGGPRAPKPTKTRPSPSSTWTRTPTRTMTPASTATRTVAMVVAQAIPPPRPTGVFQPEPTPAPKIEVKAPGRWMIWPFVGLLGLIVAVGGTYAVDKRPREVKALRKTIELIFITNLQDRFEAIAKGEK